MKNYIILLILFMALTAAIPAAIALATAPAEESRGGAHPETVSVYLTDEGRIAVMSYEEYITGCVFGTLSPKCEREALKAAACASNTFALYQLENVPKSRFSGADFCDDPELSQPYMSPETAREEYGDSYERYLEKVSGEVAEGIRYVITYDGELIFPAMCSISSGSTDDGSEISGGEFPYLKPVSAACDEQSDEYLSTVSLSARSVQTAMRDIAEGAMLPADCAQWFTQPVTRDSGTLIQITYGGRLITGEQLRKVLGLRSTAVTIDYAEDRFIFTCRGYGANVGMSLYCANTLARQGQKMADILCYFYDGAEITPL